ncbi:MAG: NAD(P)/FAD-dependent oxidoreductase, partial [Pseudonocardiales bacterium]|nr:NAD(P)/FAD-dependent oxidoreductase [Pseudonocardiales bacterium]
MGERTHHLVIIIGAGFAGVGMAIRLQQHEMTDFVVLERAADVGGTWRDNSYPGCACDVPSVLYSFSFELNPYWSRSFSGQREIWDYLRRCAQCYGLTPRIRFCHEVLAAAWDHARRCWQVSTNRGELSCDVLITATGPLSEPKIPNLPGLETFQGKVFHSARWDLDYDLRDRRVAVVGTGASAIQFIPQIQPVVGSLALFQRTPAWIMPRSERRIGDVEQRLYRAIPSLQRLVRAGIYCGRESLVPGFTVSPRLLKIAEMTARSHLRRQVADPELRAKLTPDYTIGCKRILPSNDYLPALTRPNVEVITSGLARIGADWLQAADGTRRQV